MNPLITNGVGLILVVALLIGTGWHFGSQSATKEYLPQLEAIKAVIEASDAHAQETKQEQEATHEQITKSHSDNIAAVVAFYDRMLRKAGSKVSPGPTPVCASSVDGATSEPRACERDIEFEQSCALDAFKVMGFQEWARSNRFPIE